MVSSAKPAAGTARASMPRAVPANVTIASGRRARISRAMASPGNRCPPVPPPAITTRRLASAHAVARLRRCRMPADQPRRGVLRQVEQHPDREHRDEHRRPAGADERQRQALVRQHADHDADVGQRLHGEQRRQAEGQERAVGVRHRRRDAVAAPGDDEEGQQHERRADQPELLADDRVDEVGVRLGQEADLLQPLHEAAAGDAAGADGDERLDDLEAAAGGVGPRVDPHHDPLEPLGAPRRQQDQRGQRRQRAERRRRAGSGSAGRRRRSSPPTASPGTPRCRGPAGGASARPGRRGRCRPAPRPRHVVDLVHPPRHQVGEEQDERELGELRRLHADAADAEPAPAAVDLRRRDQDEQQAERR